MIGLHLKILVSAGHGKRVLGARKRDVKWLKRVGSWQLVVGRNELEDAECFSDQIYNS